MRPVMKAQAKEQASIARLSKNPYTHLVRLNSFPLTTFFKKQVTRRGPKSAGFETFFKRFYFQNEKAQLFTLDKGSENLHVFFKDPSDAKALHAKIVEDQERLQSSLEEIENDPKLSSYIDCHTAVTTHPVACHQFLRFYREIQMRLKYSASMGLSQFATQNFLEKLNLIQSSGHTTISADDTLQMLSEKKRTQTFSWLSFFALSRIVFAITNAFFIASFIAIFFEIFRAYRKPDTVQ